MLLDILDFYEAAHLVQHKSFSAGIISNLGIFIFVWGVAGMPLYELLVLSRAATSSTVPPRAQSLSLTHPAQKDLQQAIKRTAVRLIEGNAILRTLDYLGTQRLPYRMKLQEKFVYDAR